MEDLSRHSLFGTDLCESPPHALLSAYPPPPPLISPWGQGAGSEKGALPLHLPCLPPDGGVCRPVTRLQGGGVSGMTAGLGPGWSVTPCSASPADLAAPPCPWLAPPACSVLWSLEESPDVQGHRKTASHEHRSFILTLHQWFQKPSVKWRLPSWPFLHTCIFSLGPCVCRLCTWLYIYLAKCRDLRSFPNLGADRHLNNA